MTQLFVHSDLMAPITPPNASPRIAQSFAGASKVLPITPTSPQDTSSTSSVPLHQQQPTSALPHAKKAQRKDSKKRDTKKTNLYKTELCRSWEETGTCRYGNKCQFAHSQDELRSVDRHPKYKTQLCKTFWEKGSCPYGKRCCFIHTEPDEAKGQSKMIQHSAAVSPASSLMKDSPSTAWTPLNATSPAIMSSPMFAPLTAEPTYTTLKDEDSSPNHLDMAFKSLSIGDMDQRRRSASSVGFGANPMDVFEPTRFASRSRANSQNLYLDTSFNDTFGLRSAPHHQRSESFGGSLSLGLKSPFPPSLLPPSASPTSYHHRTFSSPATPFLFNSSADSLYSSYQQQPASSSDNRLNVYN